MEDIHIINLFLERSEDAIRQVEVKYEKFCFKIAWNILYNTEDSEECVNDTWLITWNKIPPKTPTKLFQKEKCFKKSRYTYDGYLW